MNKIKKGKLFFYEQTTLIGFFFLFILIGKLLDLKILNFIIIPGIISFLAYNLLKTKLVNIEVEKLSIENEKYSEKIEEISFKSSEKAKKLIYKYFIFIYLYYIEFNLLGFPNIFLLTFFIVVFSFILTYIKVKNSKYELYKNKVLYGFFIILFLIPIINKIIHYIRSIKGV